ncbi:MAG: glycosyltransferase family 4 protein [Gemmatirosa sp.]
MMRLAVFTNQFPSRLSTFFARDMRALVDAGVELDVYALYPCDATLWSCVPALLDERVLPRERVHHLRPWNALASRPPAGSGARRFARDLWRATSAAARYGPAPVAKTAYAALLAWGWNARHQLRAHDHVLAYWGNHAATCAYLLHRLGGRDVPFSMIVHARMDLYRQPAFLAEKMCYADNVFTVCEYNRQYLRERFAAVYPRIAERVRIHHLGLDLAHLPFAEGGRPDAHLVTVGRLERLKGVHVLLDALVRLAARGVRPTLDVVGGGESLAELRARAERLGLTDRVRFLGWQNGEEVEQAMRGATVLVHPSVAPDAMPTVLKEALAVGTPVVASRLAGIPEILDDGRCGVMVPPDDVEALADAIAALLADPARRRRLATAGRAHAERVFDMQRNGRLLADVLRATRRGDARTREVA